MSSIDWILEARNALKKERAWDLDTFCGLFGLTPAGCDVVWELSHHPGSKITSTRILLVGLHFFRKYPTEREGAVFWDLNVDTWQKYRDICIERWKICLPPVCWHFSKTKNFFFRFGKFFNPCVCSSSIFLL